MFPADKAGGYMIGNILISLVVSQQLMPARAVLLIIWAGFFALFRSISEIVPAFELKSLQRS